MSFYIRKIYKIICLELLCLKHRAGSFFLAARQKTPAFGKEKISAEAGNMAGNTLEP